MLFPGSLRPGVRPPSVQTGGVVALCLLVAMLEGFDLQAVGVAALRMGPALHIAKPEMSAVFGISMLGLVAGAFAGGWAADRIGRKPVLLAAVYAFGFFSTLTYFVPDKGWLIAARLLTGLGLGGAMPNLIAMAAEISRPGRRTSTATLMFCGMPLGGAVVAALAGWLFDHMSWRAIFLVGGLAPIAIWPLLLFFLPETQTPSQQTQPELKTVLFAEGRTSPTLLLWVAFLGTALILYLMLNWLPLLAQAKGLEAHQATQAALAFNIASIFGSLALGAGIDRMGARLVLGLAYAALIGVMVLLARATGFGAIAVLSALTGFLIVGAQFALYGLAPAVYPARGRATAAGAAVAVGRFGSIAGPALAGALMAAGGAASVLMAMAPIALISGLSVVVLDTLGLRSRLKVG